jgi:transposase
MVRAYNYCFRSSTAVRRLRSEQATRHRYAIRGYISTAAKHRVSVVGALRDALVGSPWMPPIPDST